MDSERRERLRYFGFAGIVGVLLTQRMMTGPLDGFGDFWTAMAAEA